MIEEKGTVVAVSDDKIWVQTIRQSTCGSCSARKGCGQGVLARMSDGRANQVRVHNTCGATVGDPVVLGIGESQLLRASLLVYALPLGALLTGSLTGAGLWPGQDLAAIIGGGLGLAAGFLALKLLTGKAEEAARLQPALLRIDVNQAVPEPLVVHQSSTLNP